MEKSVSRVGDREGVPFSFESCNSKQINNTINILCFANTELYVARLQGKDKNTHVKVKSWPMFFYSQYIQNAKI